MERPEALAANLTQYTTGRLCKNGHLAPRYTKTGACSACVKGYVAKWNKDFVAKMTKGLRSVTYLIHPDDEPTIKAMVDAMTAARGAQRIPISDMPNPQASSLRSWSSTSRCLKPASRTRHE